jgi:hypothetical protein
VHQRWVAWAEQRLLELGEDRSLLDTLVTMPVVPEFLIPTPGARSVGVDVEIAALSGMSPQRIAAAVGERIHSTRAGSAARWHPREAAV